MKAGLVFLGVLTMITCMAQPNPVSWTFTAKKISADTYEVHMTATIQNGWHLYSQHQPEDAVAIPTTFTLAKNPLLEMTGKIKEIGKLEKFHDKELNLSANQYSRKVDFVQTVKLKGKIKTKLSGSVEYQTCDDKKCLPPKTVNFTVLLG
jgi:thiol:disulfide interchange protein DsbD